MDEDGVGVQFARFLDKLRQGIVGDAEDIGVALRKFFCTSIAWAPPTLRQLLGRSLRATANSVNAVPYFDKCGGKTCGHVASPYYRNMHGIEFV